MNASRTLSEQILGHSVGRELRAGEIVTPWPDRVMVHDSIAPSVIGILRDEFGAQAPRAPERVAVVIDHVAPAANVATAVAQRMLRSWVRDAGIERFFESGRGICHQVLIEEGLVAPGNVVVGTDSHSTTYGAVCSFGTGLGSTDVAVCLASGQTWLRVPEAIRIDVTGRFAPGFGPKDLALEIVGRLGAGGANNIALEIFGLDWLSVAGRMTVASMAVEVGAKVGMIWQGGLTEQGVPEADWLVRPEENASYARRIEVDLEALEHRVALPGRVDDLVPVSEMTDVAVDVVYVGTCTNGRNEDLRTVAELLDGSRVAPGTRLMVVPASSQVLERAVEDGTISMLLKSGATIGPPGCGACIGRHLGVLAPDEVCVFTGNRNFSGRMGSADARIYLASPQVAAASALTGRIAQPRDLSPAVAH